MTHRRAITTLVIWIALGASAWACPVCFRMDDGPVSDGVRAAVVVLMGVSRGGIAGLAPMLVRLIPGFRSAAGGKAVKSVEVRR